MTNIFPLLILNARPGAGKSELIQALRQIPLEERKARFHIGPMHVIDDFPMLWAWFEEDDILEHALGRPRLYTGSDGYFLHHDFWHLLIHRTCLEHDKWVRDAIEPHTVIIEFSRGGEHGGYRAAYQHMSDSVLSQASSLYIKVSYEESARKNAARFNLDRPDSILEHGLSSEKLERLYRHDDWDAFTDGDPAYLNVRDHRVPYVILENEDDVTTPAEEPLFQRMQDCFTRLWELYQANRAV
jgi:hypothetical protein